MGRRDDVTGKWNSEVWSEMAAWDEGHAQPIHDIMNDNIDPVIALEKLRADLEDDKADWVEQHEDELADEGIELDWNSGPRTWSPDVDRAHADYVKGYIAASEARMFSERVLPTAGEGMPADQWLAIRRQRAESGAWGPHGAEAFEREVMVRDALRDVIEQVDPDSIDKKFGEHILNDWRLALRTKPGLVRSGADPSMRFFVGGSNVKKNANTVYVIGDRHDELDPTQLLQRGIVEPKAPPGVVAGRTVAAHELMVALQAMSGVRWESGITIAGQRRSTVSIPWFQDLQQPLVKRNPKSMKNPTPPAFQKWIAERQQKAIQQWPEGGDEAFERETMVRDALLDVLAPAQRARIERFPEIVRSTFDPDIASGSGARVRAIEKHEPSVVAVFTEMMFPGMMFRFSPGDLDKARDILVQSTGTSWWYDVDWVSNLVKFTEGAPLAVRNPKSMMTSSSWTTARDKLRSAAVATTKTKKNPDDDRDYIIIGPHGDNPDPPDEYIVTLGDKVQVPALGGAIGELVELPKRPYRRATFRVKVRVDGDDFIYHASEVLPVGAKAKVRVMNPNWPPDHSAAYEHVSEEMPYPDADDFRARGLGLVDLLRARIEWGDPADVSVVDANDWNHEITTGTVVAITNRGTAVVEEWNGGRRREFDMNQIWLDGTDAPNSLETDVSRGLVENAAAIGKKKRPPYTGRDHAGSKLPPPPIDRAECGICALGACTCKRKARNPMSRELAKGTAVELEHTKSRARAKKIAEDHLAEHPDYYSRLERCFPGEHDGLARSNPASAQLEDAKAKFEEFHAKKPTKIGEFHVGFEIPPTVGECGKAIHVLYRSNKKDPVTLKQAKNPVDYIHEHYAGVKYYACDDELEQVEVPDFVRRADALVLLGLFLGARFEDDEGEHDAEGADPLPELYSTPCGKALIVVQSKKEVLAMIWGGGLGVWARGIDG